MSNFGSLQIAPVTIMYVFDREVALRFGRQYHGGAGYCLSDVYPENIQPSANMKAATQAMQTQAAMAKDPGNRAWQAWKIRLWNVCAFGMSLGAEAGTAFLIEREPALASGDRYRPMDPRVLELWKTMSGVTSTFVKVNLVPSTAVVLDTLAYDQNGLTEASIDTLYGAVLERLSALATPK
ncbi:hypothetical protein [Actinomadura sp. 6N118]|uniref:hypothetical protein n=1 Tax=Actinomadura sp. 6N118 TaxID=3375151 RepID=UPI0037B74EEC